MDPASVVFAGDASVVDGDGCFGSELLVSAGLSTALSDEVDSVEPVVEAVEVEPELAVAGLSAFGSAGLGRQPICERAIEDENAAASSKRDFMDSRP